MTVGSPARVYQRVVERSTHGSATPGVHGGASGVLLLGALGVGAALRLQGIGDVGFGSDEAVYALQSRALSEGDIVIRAHPLGWIAVGAVFGAQADDVSLRSLSAIAGVATIAATFALARSLPVARRGEVAVVAAWLIALMPYHVDVSRQYLLDGPVALATTVYLVCLLRFDRSGQRAWLIGAAAAAVVAIQVKESALLIIAASFVAVLLSPSPARRRMVAVVSAGAALSVACWAALAVVAGSAGVGRSYLVWQFTRPANAPWDFYGQQVLPAVGLVAIAAAAIGAAAIGRRWAGQLLIACVLVPLIFFAVWPVKGYAYVTPAAPVVAVLAAVGIMRLARSAPVSAALRSRWAGSVLAGLLVVGCAASAALWPASPGPLPGRDGLAQVRETARWIAEQPPGGVLADSSAVGNVIAFYSGRTVTWPSADAPARYLNPAYRVVDSNLRPVYFVTSTWAARNHATATAEVISQAGRADARLLFTAHETGHPGGTLPTITVWGSDASR